MKKYCDRSFTHELNTPDFHTYLSTRQTTHNRCYHPKGLDRQRFNAHNSWNFHSIQIALDLWYTTTRRYGFNIGDHGGTNGHRYNAAQDPVQKRYNQIAMIIGGVGNI